MHTVERTAWTTEKCRRTQIFSAHRNTREPTGEHIDSCEDCRDLLPLSSCFIFLYSFKRVKSNLHAHTASFDFIALPVRAVTDSTYVLKIRLRHILKQPMIQHVSNQLRVRSNTMSTQFNTSSVVSPLVP